MPLLSSLSNWLAEQLAARGWSRRRAGRELHIGRNTVLRILNEPGWTPSPRTLARIERDLGLQAGLIREHVDLGQGMGDKAVATKRAKGYDFREWSRQARAGRSPNWAAKAAGAAGGRKTARRGHAYFVSLGKQSWKARKGEAPAPDTTQAQRAAIPRGPRIAKKRFLEHRGPGGGGAITRDAMIAKYGGPDVFTIKAQLALQAPFFTKAELTALRAAQPPELRPLFDKQIAHKRGPRARPRLAGRRGRPRVSLEHASERTRRRRAREQGFGRPRGRPRKTAKNPA